MIKFLAKSIPFLLISTIIHAAHSVDAASTIRGTSGDLIITTISTGTGNILINTKEAGTALFINTSNNLGIGTSGPVAGLEIAKQGDVAQGGNFLKVNANYGTGVSGSYTASYINAAYGSSSSGSLTGFKVDVANGGTGNTYAAVFNGGNVGIGTASPADRLDVAGNIRIGGTGSSGYGGIIKSGVYPYETFLHYTDDGSGYGPAWIHTNTAGGGTTHPTMFLQTSGNRAVLNVNDQIALGSMTDSITDSTYPVVTSSTLINGRASGNSYFNNGGNVGIGTTTPAQKLSVVGTIESTSGGFKFPDGTTQTTASGASSQWTTTGSNIYYNTGSVGIGPSVPTNILSVAPLQHSAGTASQSGTTITGSGTTFTSAMTGSQFYFANGVSGGNITYVSATQLTSSVSQTVASQSYAIAYKGLQVASNGNVNIHNNLLLNNSSISGIDGLTINDSSGANSLSEGIIFTQASGGGGGNIRLNTVDSAANNNLEFLSNSATNSNLIIRNHGTGSFNVGIGTTAPSQNLHIANAPNGGGFMLASTQSGGASGPFMMFRSWTGTTNSDAALGYGGDGKLAFQTTNGATKWLEINTSNGAVSIPGDLTVTGTCTGCGGSSQWTTSGTDIYNNTSGNVGIGAAPNSNHVLDIQRAITSTGVSQTSAIKIRNSFTSAGLGNSLAGVSVGGGSGAGTGPTINMSSLANSFSGLNSDGRAWTVSNAGTATGFAGYFAAPTAFGTNYSIYSAAGTNYFAGNVGIGTTNPGSLLHLSANGGDTPQLRFTNTAGGSSWYVSQRTTGLNFAELSAADGRLFLQNGGNVGIGTTSPGSKLEVRDGITTLTSGNNDAYGQLRVQTTGTLDHDAQLTFATARNGRGIYVDDSDGNKLKFYSGWGKGVVGKEITFDNEGNVGIGTTTPGYKLTVQGGAIGGNYGLTPNYAAWSAYNTGDGGAAIYNDNGSYKKLMIVGNNSAGGSREVGIWDNLTVNGNANVVGTLTAPTATAGTNTTQVATTAFVQAAVSGAGAESGPRALSAESGSSYYPNQAAEYCFNLTAPAFKAMNGDITTSYSDWRMPTVEELSVFMIVGPAYPNYLWTASTTVNTSNYLYRVISTMEGNLGYSDISQVKPVRCVR